MRDEKKDTIRLLEEWKELNKTLDAKSGVERGNRGQVVWHAVDAEDPARRKCEQLRIDLKNRLKLAVSEDEAEKLISGRSNNKNLFACLDNDGLARVSDPEHELFVWCSANNKKAQKRLLKNRIAEATKVHITPGWTSQTLDRDTLKFLVDLLMQMSQYKDDFRSQWCLETMKICNSLLMLFKLDGMNTVNLPCICWPLSINWLEPPWCELSLGSVSSVALLVKSILKSYRWICDNSPHRGWEPMQRLHDSEIIWLFNTRYRPTGGPLFAFSSFFECDTCSIALARSKQTESGVVCDCRNEPGQSPCLLWGRDAAVKMLNLN